MAVPGRPDVTADDGTDVDARAAGAGAGAAVVTVGVFDGVHRGHQVIMARAAAVAASAGLPCVVLTFDPHPGSVVRPDSKLPLLSTVAHRTVLLRAAGADAVVVLPFTHELSQLSAEDFVRDVLVGRLHAQTVVIGANFRFGHRAAGTVQTLAELGLKYGFTVEVVGLVGRTSRPDAPDAPVWSSTRVRRCVLEGDVATAAQILGRPHRVEGEVVHGDQRGRELGYPTANVAAAADAAVPADGVYSGWLVRADGERLPAAVSVGTNPTFDGAERRVEAYVLDRTGLDLYGEQVAVEFAHRLRATERFDSVDALLVQMSADVATARAQVG